MLVYLEYAIIENLVIDYFLLKVSLFFSGVKTKWYKKVFAVVIGTAFAIVLPLFYINNILAFFIKILLAISIVYIAGEYKSIKSYFLTLNIFLLCTFLTGGACIAILYLCNMQFVLKGGKVVNQGMPVAVIIGGAFIITSVILRVGKSIYRKKNLVPFMQKCQIVLGGKGFCLNGFVDTGNRLYDDKRGCPIIVVSKFVAEKHNLLPYLTERVGSINYSTIGGKSVMPIYKLSGVILYINDSVLYKTASLGVSENAYDKDYDIILHPALI
ncbi:MAG: sigma-E processing peptidase SpoIIGA [Clostridia bacterium]|nr:sigma-E processing peptidase SpoIIGA [Clostridia bacterium]